MLVAETTLGMHYSAAYTCEKHVDLTEVLFAAEKNNNGKMSFRVWFFRCRQMKRATYNNFP